MTSFAFILGLVPLIIASGASEASPRGVGSAVFRGMLIASTVGIFLIPMLYVPNPHALRRLPVAAAEAPRRAGEPRGVAKEAPAQ